MRTGFQFIMCFFLCYQLALGQGRNTNWLYGQHQSRPYEQNKGKVLVKETEEGMLFEKVNSPLNFESTMAAISDDNGNLFLYTNGCAIADLNHQIIPGGTGLNPGTLHDMVCEDYGYLAPNGAMFITWPDNPDKYILLHLGTDEELIRKNIYNSFYYTVIEEENSQFSVAEKNVELISGGVESFAVIQHGNGKDWWVFVPESTTNLYHRFLVDSSGIHRMDPQQEGFALPADFCKMPGISTFSPDGKRYLRFNNSCGFLLFDFDRCTGLISNCIYENVGSILDDPLAFCVFSPDSKYIYINKTDYYTYDTRVVLTMFYKVHINKIGIAAYPSDRFSAGYWTINKLFFSQQGKLFVEDAFSSIYLYELIPDHEKGTIEVAPLNTQTENTRTVPYFANFDLPPVDCTPVSSTDQEKSEFSLSIYPNPFSDMIFVRFSGKDQLYSMNLYDTAGNQIHVSPVFHTENHYSFSLTNIPSGVYFLRINAGNVVHTCKIIKI